MRMKEGTQGKGNLSQWPSVPLLLAAPIIGLTPHKNQLCTTSAAPRRPAPQQHASTHGPRPEQTGKIHSYKSAAEADGMNSQEDYRSN
jgi:hypothetical protein